MLPNSEIQRFFQLTAVFYVTSGKISSALFERYLADQS